MEYKSLKLAGNNEQKSVNILDLLKYLLLHWKWYLLSIVLFVGFFYYQYSKTSFVYTSSQTVMIKTASNTISTSRIARPNNMFSAVNVNSEILQLRSKELMEKTVKELQANVSYSVLKRLRNYELYKSSPFLVTFTNIDPAITLSFTIEDIGKNKVILSDFSNSDPKKRFIVTLDELVKTPIGVLTVTKNKSLTAEKSVEQKIKVTSVALNSMAAHFLNGMFIKQLEDVEILRISMEDTNPERAADVITKLIEVYNYNSIRNKNQIAVNTANFIQERLHIIQNELGSVEGSLEQMKTANQGMDVKAAGDLYWSDSRRYDSSSKDVETQKAMVEIMRKRLNDPAMVNELIPSNTGLVESFIEAQIAEYNGVLLRRNRLQQGNSSENPVIQDLNLTLGAMRENITRAVDNVIAGFDIKISSLRKEENAAIQKAKGLPSQQRQMLTVERQQKVKEDLYLFLLNRREENALNQAMTDDNIRVLDGATLNPYPIAPSRFKKVAIGAGIGFILPTVVLLFMLFLNTKIRFRKDLEEGITIPFIGELPFSKGHKWSESEVVVHEQGTDSVTEAFRILRTNLGFMISGEKELKVITFTSFNVGAGKTFSAINLAVSMSFLKKKVVVLDLDLRKGTLSSKTRIPMPVGVTNFLSDATVNLDQIIYKDRLHADVDIVPIGVIAPNPVELLLSKRLDLLLEQLKERYDYIIVDNVPLGIVADSTIVNRITDLTIFVVRAGKMDKRQLPELEKVYQDGILTNLGVILNGVRFDQASYGYGYGYGYGGYGYGYGYGYELKKKSRWEKFWGK